MKQLYLHQVFLWANEPYLKDNDIFFTGGKDQALPLDEIDHMSPADSDPLQIIRRVAQSQASALAEGNNTCTLTVPN